VRTRIDADEGGTAVCGNVALGMAASLGETSWQVSRLACVCKDRVIGRQWDKREPRLRPGFVPSGIDGFRLVEMTLWVYERGKRRINARGISKKHVYIFVFTKTDTAKRRRKGMTGNIFFHIIFNFAVSV